MPMGSDKFVNRELSWLEFNRRVLEEAQDPSVPLLERLKFLSIFSSNLDEFFMVRVAALKRRIREGEQTPTPDGLTPAATMAAVSARVHELVELQHRTFLQDQEVSAQNRMPIVPDDFICEAAGKTGDRIVVSYRNTTGGAITAFLRVEVIAIA